MSSRTFTLRHCPVPAAHAVELRVCNIIDRVSNSAPVCTKETDDTPSLWSISGTQGIPHLCPRRSKSPRSQTLVLLWTRRCVCVESPGPTGLVLLASTINKIMLVRSSRLYKFARRTKNITECRLIRQRWAWLLSLTANIPNAKSTMSQMGQSRRLSDVGMSASPPTTDESLDAVNRR